MSILKRIFKVQFNLIKNFRQKRTPVIIALIRFNRIDWRLSFVNLKDKEASNGLSRKDRERLWFPNLVFENSQNGPFVKDEPLSVFNVKHEGHPTKKFNFDINEYQEYRGVESPIIFENIYELNLACEMELHFYPFDTQHCFIQVNIF